MAAEVRVSEFLGPRDQRPYGEQRVRFIEDWRELRKESEDAGRKICKRLDMIEVTGPGGDITCVVVSPAHIQAYPRQWAAYSEVMGDLPSSVIGTPLKEWAPMPRFMVEEFGYLKIRTVEELSQIPAEVTEKWPTLREWASKAVTWLESANTKQAEVAKIRKQLETLEAKYQKLLDQNAILIKRVQEAEGGGIGLVPA